MGMFNFIETFFFISLAITFVLILLLVYHFKQRIISLEQKSDTMFDIINTIVKEITYLRNIRTVNTFQPENIIRSFQTVYSNDIATSYDKIPIIEEEEADEEDEEEEEEEEEEDEEEEDDEDDEEEEEPVIIKKIILLDNDDQNESIVVSENNKEVAEEINDIKTINLNLEEDLYEYVLDEVVLENTNEPPDAENVVDSIEESLAGNEVNNQEDEAKTEEENEDEDEQKKKEWKETINKMSTAALKVLVAQKKLVGEASKLRRPELIKLLEGEP